MGKRMVAADPGMIARTVASIVPAEFVLLYRQPGSTVDAVVTNVGDQQTVATVLRNAAEQAATAIDWRKMPKPS